MKRLLILALACLVLFAGCKEKSESQLENEQIQAVEDSAETESSLEQEVDSVDTDDSQDAVAVESENTENEQLLSFEDEIPQFDAVETLFYPETVKLAMEEETELLKTQDFAISIVIKSKEEGKDRPTYYCDYYITDSAQNKNLLFTSDFPYIGEVENPIYPYYKFLNKEKPLVKADINNNGIDDYIFVVKADRSRDMIAFEKKDSAYKGILKWYVFVDGGPENDDIAESIVFNSGESKNEIIIDYAPYNKHCIFVFDESAYEYKRDEQILQSRNKYLLWENKYLQRWNKYV